MAVLVQKGARILWLFVLAWMVVSCATYPKSSREDQWSYFEEWDTNRNVGLDITEFVTGYNEEEYFRTWAGRKKEMSNDVLVAKLNGSGKDLKIALAAEGNGGAVASNRRESTDAPVAGQLSQIRQFVDLADMNGNRRISRDEWARAMFRLADENNDLVLTPIEFYLWELLRG